MTLTMWVPTWAIGATVGFMLCRSLGAVRSPGRSAVIIAVALILAWPAYYFGLVFGGYVGAGLAESFGGGLGPGSHRLLVGFGIAVGAWLVGALPLALLIAALGSALRPKDRG